MKPEELRIGNIVAPHREFGIGLPYIQIEYIDKDGYCFKDGDKGELHVVKVDPVPITSDWLLKFRFTEEGHTKFGSVIERFFNVPGHENLSLVLLSNGARFEVETEDNISTPFASIQYVHELQNLFFAMTGIELRPNAL